MTAEPTTVPTRPTPSEAPPGRSRKITGRSLGYIGKTVMVLLGLLMLAPFWWTAVTSIVPSARAFSVPPDWFPKSWDLTNYRQVFRLLPFLTQILNSIKITVSIVVGSLVVSSLAAYAFARLKFPGRGAIFGIFLVALMVPSQVTLIPTYILMRYLGLLDTHTSLILPALIQVFSIFMLRQHFLSLPVEIEEAAKLDGASHLRILTRIFLPMSSPIISALAIFIASTYWNDFVTPNTYLSSPNKLTIPVGLTSLQNQFGSSPATVVFAGITIIVIPLLILFLFTQRKLSEGVSLQGVSK
jgi:multiple sugar transport system permease protein